MTNNLIVRDASQVVTCSGTAAKRGSAMADLGVIENGSVVIENGIISAVGPSARVLPSDTGGFRVIDARGRAVLPGFVDAHTHLVFGGFRAEEFGWRLRGMRYMEIMRRGGGILNTMRATRQSSREALCAAARRRLDSLLGFGVTTVEAKSGYGLDLENELKQLEVMADLAALHPVEVVPTFMGAHAVPPEYQGRADDYINFLGDTVLPAVADRKLARFCDVFCEQGVFSVEQSRRLLIRAKQLGFGLKLHADEIVRLGGAELAAEVGAVSADHLLQASDQGIAMLAASGVVATLLPGTAFSLKEPYARGRTMIDQGCAVALASDLNPGSCFTESMPLVIALACLYMGLSPEEAISAVTLNGAAALGLADTIGSLDPGKQADLVILEFPTYHFIPYHIGVSTVQTVIKKGRVVFEKQAGPLPKC